MSPRFNSSLPRIPQQRLATRPIAPIDRQRSLAAIDAGIPYETSATGCPEPKYCFAETLVASSSPDKLARFRELRYAC